MNPLLVRGFFHVPFSKFGLVEQDLLYEDDGETALLISDRSSSTYMPVPAED